MLSPDERAEHIVTELDCDSCQYSYEIRQATTVYIAEQIRKAVEEAHHDCTATHKNHKCSVCFEAGEATAATLKRELMEALKDAVTTATSGYRAGAKSVEKWKEIIACAEASL